MSLQFVLQVAGQKLGLNPLAPSQRSVLLRYANEAAEELYDQFDPPGCLLEQTFKVNGDQTISMPYYVGEIRGVREDASWLTWHVNKQRPRYNQYNWEDCWRNIRLKNSQCLQTTVTNQSVLIFTVKAVESPAIQITVSGANDDSSEANEIVTMSSTTVQSVNKYNDVNLLRKNTVSVYDITVSDIDGKLLSLLPNIMLEAAYQIYDVSMCPWTQQNSSTQDHYLEVLFKKALPWYENDSDTFPAQKYDNIWVNKIMQLKAEDEGKMQDALAWDAKATRSASRKKDNRNESTEDKVAVVANPHDNLLPRIRPGYGRHRYYRGRYM